MVTKSDIAGYKPEYVLGLPEIDEQHEGLFHMVAKLGDVTTDKYKPLDDDEVDEVIDIFAQLRDAALLHFDTEEHYMHESGYTDLEAHKTEHARFINHITRMEAELMNGSAVPVSRILTLLHDWYSDHITQQDKPFAEFYNNNKE